MWSPDGKHLYFSSDRNGVFNIYAIDLENEELFRVTNVLTGAFRPQISPDESQLYFSIYQHYGYGIASMKNIPSTWKSQGKIQSAILYGSSLSKTILLTIFSPLPKSKDRKLQEEEPSWSGEKTRFKIRLPLCFHIHKTLSILKGLQALEVPWKFWKTRYGVLGSSHEGTHIGEFFGGTNIGSDLQGNQELHTEDKEENEYPFTYPVSPMIQHEIYDRLSLLPVCFEQLWSFSPPAFLEQTHSANTSIPPVSTIEQTVDI